MSDRIERFIIMAFNDWKKGNPEPGNHPDEEALACFLDGKLSRQDADRIREHLVCCDACASLVAADLYAYPAETVEVPEHVLARARALVKDAKTPAVLEIALRIKDLGFEMLKTTGDVLFGQEFIPAAALRGRHITDFKEEVVVVRDFSAGRVEVKLQAQAGALFGLSVSVKDKKTHKAMQDLRVTLMKGDIELESRVTDKGRAVFDHVAAGRYHISITGLKQDIARITIEVEA